MGGKDHRVLLRFNVTLDHGADSRSRRGSWCRHMYQTFLLRLAAASQDVHTPAWHSPTYDIFLVQSF